MSPLPVVDKRNIVQGEYLVSGEPNVMIQTMLGSCVAACLRDPKAGVGGMNHFLLPGDKAGNEGRQYGAHLMELLINGLLARGARRDRLEGKLFGGGRMLTGLTDIGRQNAVFAEQYFRDEGIALLGASLGGDHARRVQFWPVSGRARQILLVRDGDVFARERTPAAVRVDGDLELFG